MSTPAQFLNTEDQIQIEYLFNGSSTGTALLGTPNIEGSADFPVTGVSLTDGDFTPVPAGSVGGTPGATIDGPYLDTDVDADGSIGIVGDSGTSYQQLANLINSNTTGTPVEQTLYYQVSDGTTTVTDSVQLQLNDFTVGYINGTQSATVAENSTTLLSDVSITTPASTDGNAVSADPNLVVSLIVGDNSDANGVSGSAQGTIGFAQSATLAGNVQGAGTNDLTITGTETQVNADLAQLEYTSTGAGQDSLTADIEQTTGANGTGTVVQNFDGAYVGAITTACYLKGTRISTASGDVAIEALNVGDAVRTASGDFRPVRWLGHRRLNCARHPNPSAVWPIRGSAGAFGANLPARDLWLSPGHSVFFDGTLIQIENLINDATIVQVPREEVEYWHVELDAHDIVMAEGLPAESYLDTGNRTAFVNGGAFLEAHPDFKPRHWRETCAPLVVDGPALRKAKATLLSRAKHIGYQMSTDSDAHVLCDGRRIEAMRLTEKRWAFVIPAGGSGLELRCRGFVPAHVDVCSSDRRLLGLSVSRVQIDGVDLDLKNDDFFENGWHKLEAHRRAGAHRWSHERVPLPEGARLIVIDLVEPTRGWAPRTTPAALTLCG